MKIQYFLQLSFLMFILSINNPLSASEDWAQFGKYQEQNDSIKKLPLQSRPKVVFMGNSITEGWMKEDPEFFKENNFACRGISGQTTYQMLDRFREDVINLKPEVVVITAGTNDVAENNHNYNEDITLGNIISMSELAGLHDIQVVLTSVLPTDHFYWNPQMTDIPEKLMSLNKRIRLYAQSQNLPFADYYSSMHDNKYAMKEGLSLDGVHPSLEGYKIMEDIISPIISRELNQSSPIITPLREDEEPSTHSFVGSSQNSIYEFKIPTQKGDSVSMDQFRGKVILIVNTASKCGFTLQYSDLEHLYETYKDQGFEIIDFPCNQFGNQSPESDEETTQFCQLNYGTQFPQYHKIEVNGENQLPLYAWLKSQKGFEGFDTSTQLGELLDNMMKDQNPDYAGIPDIKWNFTKFLIDKNGNVVERFEPTTDMKIVEEKIKENLNKMALQTKEEYQKEIFFPIGDPNTGFAKYFIGQSYLAPVSTEQIPFMNVTFEPACRNNWHIHHATEGGGQMLVGVGGKGWYQEEGKDPVEILPGTVINIPANVKHWHGAQKDSWFSHLAFSVPGQNESTEWLEPVDDEYYNNIK